MFQNVRMISINSQVRVSLVIRVFVVMGSFEYLDTDTCNNFIGSSDEWECEENLKCNEVYQFIFNAEDGKV